MGFFTDTKKPDRVKDKEKDRSKSKSSKKRPSRSAPPSSNHAHTERKEEGPTKPPRPALKSGTKSYPAPQTVHQAGAPVIVHNHFYINSAPSPEHLQQLSHHATWPLPQSHPKPLQHSSQTHQPIQQWTPHPSGVTFSESTPQEPPNSSSRPSYPLTKSMADLAKGMTTLPTSATSMSAWFEYGTQVATAYDDMFSRFNNVMKLDEKMTDSEMDISGNQAQGLATPSLPVSKSTTKSKKDKEKEKQSATGVAASVISGNYFSKAEQYSNSRLPPNLAAFAVYMPTWPLLTLAAQYSLSVYEPSSTPNSTTSLFPSNWRTGDKAMCLSSVPMDHMHTIVFAIRGTASFLDWAVNLQHNAASPQGFLDDEGNLCHAGFLSVAKKMVKSVATRLRELLAEDPSRAKYSLLITGHSAGGAVASLLYCHMLAQNKEAASELNRLTSHFKRVHCVTFGTPPVSLLPLQKPPLRSLRNSIFLSFVNEGDPVTRVDKGYIKSLFDVLAGPGKSKKKDDDSYKPVWDVPPCTLSNPGRIVVLRSAIPESDTRPSDHKTMRERLREGVVANVVSDEQLRGQIWADPVSHLMRLYAGRIEAMAVAAVTAQGQSVRGRIAGRP